MDREGNGVTMRNWFIHPDVRREREREREREKSRERQRQRERQRDKLVNHFSYIGLVNT